MASGSGPGAITADGCAVEVYRRLPENGEADVVHAAVPSGAAVLDLGAGVGRIAHPLATLGHRVVAVDDSPEMLAWVSPPVKPVRGAIERLALPERFGGVLLASHLLNSPAREQRRGFLRTAARHLAPGGVLVAQWHPPGWFARLRPGARHRGTQGEVVTDLLVEGLDEGMLRATVVYRADGLEWKQSFTAARLDVPALDDDLASAGLERRDWLTADHTWWSAVRAARDELSWSGQLEEASRQESLRRADPAIGPVSDMPPSASHVAPVT